MTDKALYILAGYDDDTERYLAGIQNALYEKGFCWLQTKGIPQHITLGSFSVEMEGELGALLKSLSQTIEPVSYTHLDVYKRQEIHFKERQLERQDYLRYRLRQASMKE